jgi:hypothetical protein
MKRFIYFKLTKGLIVLFTLGVVLIPYSTIPDYYSAFQVQAQVQQQQEPPPPPPPQMGIKITSPNTGQQVPVGELTISGISTYNATTDCTVHADWNNTKPLQIAVATGAGGVNDYSTWNFTYSDDYHLITNGTNNLTSKLSCVDDSTGGTTNLTQFYSVNVIGVAGTTTTAANNSASTTSTSEEEVQKQQESPAIDSNLTTTKENNTAAAAAAAAAAPTGLGPSAPTLSPVPLPPSSEEEQEPPGAVKPEDDQDSTIYWDIE